MRRVGDYVLSTRLASGTLGDVFLARLGAPGLGASGLGASGLGPQEEGQEQAVKLIRPEIIADLRFARLLMAERPSAEAFRHPSAVDLKRVERHNDEAFIAMELLGGQPFGAVGQRARIDQEPLPHRLVAWIGAQMAEALIEAHKTPWFSGAPAPIVHGALAPRSIFITYDGQVRLVGLGLGRARHVMPPSPSRLPYLAPEILQGRDLTVRADVYGLAVILYEAFTGRSLFRRTTAEATKAAVLQANVPRLNARNLDVNPDIGDLLADMMAPRPAARPPFLDEAQAALRSASDGEDDAFRRLLASVMQSRFREEHEAFQRQVAVAHRQRPSPVVSGVGPVAVGNGGGSPSLPVAAVTVQPVVGAPSSSPEALPVPSAVPSPAGAARVTDWVSLPPPELSDDDVPIETDAVAYDETMPDRHDGPDLSSDLLIPQSPPTMQIGTPGAADDEARVGDVGAGPTMVVRERKRPPADDESRRPPPLPPRLPRSRPMSGWSAAPLTASLEEGRSPTVSTISPGPPAAPSKDVFPPEGASSTVAPAAAEPDPLEPLKLEPDRPPNGAPGRSGRPSEVPAKDAADRPATKGTGGPPTLEEPAPASLQAELETRRSPGGIPARVGRYHIKSALAQVRGMWVLTGWDPNLSRPVRIHLLDPRRGWDPHQGPDQRVARFKVAARRWSTLRHPTLPTLLDGGRDDALYFLVFENPVGSPLTELLTSADPPSQVQVRSLLVDIAGGLHYLHSRGLVLGHVRAASVIVGQEGPRFVDLAHLGESGELGAPPRPLLAQAPENLAGAPYDHRSEQFALGSLLYQLLVGKRPFEGVDDQALAAAMRHRTVSAPVDLVPNVDSALSRCCMRMLSQAPEQRYSSLSAVLGVLRGPRIPSEDTQPDAPRAPAAGTRGRSVVIIEPAMAPDRTEAILGNGGVSAQAYRTWAEAERELDGLHPSLLVISSAAGTVTPPERTNTEWRFVPPAASRLLGPPLATEGLVERLAALSSRALGIGPTPLGPPEGWPSRLARQVCLRLGLGHDTAVRVAVAMAFRQMQTRLRLSANDIVDLVPVEARNLFRFRPQPGLPGPPAAQTLWAVELFFSEMQPSVGPGRRPAKVLQTLRAHVGTELDGGVMEALVAQLRELYPELDLPAAPSGAPRVLLAGLRDRPELVEALEREGFDVDTAVDGHEVWLMLRAKPYRAVVIAQPLDGRDAASLLKLSRNHPETRDVSFLILAGAPSQDLQRAVDSGGPAELMSLDSPLEALRVRIVRLMKENRP